MAKKIRSNTNLRQVVRLKRRVRGKKTIALHQGRVARLVVFRSNRFLYAQIVDDKLGHTVASANTQEDGFNTLASRKNIEAAGALGKLVGERALTKKIERVVFDRNGYNYHGRVKALADAARAAGLRF